MAQRTSERLNVARGVPGQGSSPEEPARSRPGQGRLRPNWLAAVIPPSAGNQPATRTAKQRVQLTSRGALVGLFALCLLSCLVAEWKQVDVIAGLAYCAGCVTVPAYVRREAQLRVVIAPPAVFLIAVLVTQAFTAQGSSGRGSILSVIEGTFLMLAATAPWLVAGTCGCVAVSMFRGLPDCWRQFRAAGGWQRS